MNYPIFILGAHKSGTSLLRSLFDGHTDLFVIPKETHLFEMTGYWVDYQLRRKQPQTMTPKKIVNAFTSMIEEYNSVANYKADNVTLDRWDTAIFRKSLESSNLSNPNAIFTAVFQAMHQSLHGHPLNALKHVVEKSVEHAEFALDLNVIFPEARFIHLIRNPYANLVSLRRFKSENGYPFLKGLIHSLYNSYYHLYRNSRLLTNYIIVRYEDLVTNPKKTVNELIQFIDIPFQEILLQPTVDGKHWGGNSAYSSHLSGISTASLTKWQSEIYDLEIKLLNQTIPAHFFSEYKYEQVERNVWPKKPIPGESLKRYLGNRLLSYYL